MLRRSIKSRMHWDSISKCVRASDEERLPIELQATIPYAVACSDEVVFTFLASDDFFGVPAMGRERDRTNDSFP